MILKGISVNQNPPAKDYLWITPKGNTRFWNQSVWRLVSGNRSGGSGSLPEIETAGKYLITAGSSGDYYATWGDLDLSSYLPSGSGSQPSTVPNYWININGEAGYVKYQHTNEINFKNVPSNWNGNIWFNYKNGDTDAVDTSDINVTYKFGNTNAKTSKTTLDAASFTGNAATATTASKLGTSTIGNSITPFYLSNGSPIVCDLYRYHYDSTSDYASYAWHKVAYAVSTSANEDRVLTLLVSKGNSFSIGGILRCRLRINNSSYDTNNSGIYWLFNSGNISISSFVMVWTSSNSTIELWCKITEQWGGYQFVVLDSGSRSSNGLLTWVMCNSVNGHGSASYTSGDNVKTSKNGNLSVGSITATGASSFSGGVTFSNASFNYSGIEKATGSAHRPIWFSDSSVVGKPCYNNDILTLNPSTRELILGNTDNTTETMLRMRNSVRNVYFDLTSAGNFGLWDTTNSRWCFVSNKSNSTFYIPAEKVGIGFSNGTTLSVKLSVSGDIYATGGVAALQTISSDRRLKKEIKPFNAKQIIGKLKPVEFEWNKKANKYNSNLELNKKNYGLIAQDSDGIIDNLVFDLPDGNGYKGVRYEKLIPILLQAVKEQQKEIDELKQIIKKLKV